MERRITHQVSRKIKMVHIARDIIEGMESHARESYPLECCGLLAGKEKLITAIFQTRNAAVSVDKYEIDAVEQLNVFEEIDRRSLKLLGIYHDDNPMQRFSDFFISTVAIKLIFCCRKCSNHVRLA